MSLKLALEQAKQSATRGEVPVGAVVVKDGKVIAQAGNSKESTHDPAGHAEVIAIREAARILKNWRLIDCELYVTLEPCPMCLALCQQSRLSKVVYGAQDPKGGALSLGYELHQDSRLNHSFVAEFEPNSDCEQVLKDFFKERRKK